MITAEQARQNTEQSEAAKAAIRQRKAEEYVQRVIEPKILEASQSGNWGTFVDIKDVADVAHVIATILKSAGFECKYIHQNNGVVTEVSVEWRYHPNSTRNNREVSIGVCM